MRSAVTLLAVCCCIPACIGLTVTSISVPGMLMRGGVAYLRCNFEADDEEEAGKINVTWYKDGHKFFHTVTKGLNANNTVFDVPGVEVDENDSFYRSLTLKPLWINTGGEYRCKASSMKNSDMSDIKKMLVVATPEEDPMISGFREGIWVPNGTLELNCTSGKSFPASNLTWLVKGEEPDENLVTPWPTETDDEGLKTSKLGLTIQLGPDIRTEVVQVTCEANYKKKVIEEWADGLSASTLTSKRTVTKTVGPGSGAAQTGGQLTAALLVLLCSLAAAPAR